MNRVALFLSMSAVAFAACSDPQCAPGEHKIADMCYPDKRDSIDEVTDGDRGDDARVRSNVRSDAASSKPDARLPTAPESESDTDGSPTAGDAQPSLGDAGTSQGPADPRDASVAREPPVEVDPCANVNGVMPCATNAVCSAVGGKAVCACRAAYVGDGKTCTFDSSCSQLNCDKNAECVMTGSDARECRCRMGFMGSGTSCSNTNECAASPCGANADCKDTEGSYECSCKDGYEKRGAACVEIDECKTSPCAHGRCVDQVGSRSCDCAGTGFHGERCEIDDCSTLSCGPGTRCENVSGSARCVALCGNKKLDQGEDCDWSVSGELPGYSCSTDCQKTTFLTTCDADPCKGNSVCVRMAGTKSWCTVPCNVATLSCPALPGVSAPGGSCGTIEEYPSGALKTACAYRCSSDANCPAHFKCDATLVCIPR